MNNTDSPTILSDQIDLINQLVRQMSHTDLLDEFDRLTEEIQELGSDDPKLPTLDLWLVRIEDRLAEFDED